MTETSRCWSLQLGLVSSFMYPAGGEHHFDYGSRYFLSIYNVRNRASRHWFALFTDFLCPVYACLIISPFLKSPLDLSASRCRTHVLRSWTIPSLLFLVSAECLHRDRLIHSYAVPCFTRCSTVFTPYVYRMQILSTPEFPTLQQATTLRISGNNVLSPAQLHSFRLFFDVLVPVLPCLFGTTSLSMTLIASLTGFSVGGGILPVSAGFMDSGLW